MPEITSYTAAHMSAQIRAKQLATKATQDRLNAAVKQALEDGADESGEAITARIRENLSTWLGMVQGVNTVFAPRETTLDVGYPIKFNKTDPQLQMAVSWVESRDDFITDLNSDIMYHGLKRSDISQLPTSQAPSDSVYWGNENSSVSTVLLYSAAHSLGSKVDQGTLTGAATFYPFLKADYTIEVTESNPFVFENGVLLFGDYQFGGHRNFSKEHSGTGQLLFAPEDCTSAVGKATRLTEDQVVSIWTGSIKAAYADPNHEYGYQAITSSAEGESFDFDKIELGDIFMIGGHVAIVGDKDNAGNITTFEFNRDIDREEGKFLGGAMRQYNLIELAQGEKPIYILRSGNTPVWEESGSLEDFVAMVDANYDKKIDASAPDTRGDCSIFFDPEVQQVDLAGVDDAAAVE